MLREPRYTKVSFPMPGRRAVDLSQAPITHDAEGRIEAYVHMQGRIEAYLHLQRRIGPDGKLVPTFTCPICRHTRELFTWSHNRLTADVCRSCARAYGEYGRTEKSRNTINMKVIAALADSLTREADALTREARHHGKA